MLALRGLQSLKTAVLPQHGLTRGTVSCLRSFCAAAVTHTEDTPLVQMKNPFKEPEKGCLLCSVTVDFKNTQLLSQFVSPHTGRIYGRHITGLCGRKQKEISKAIKKAHAMGFMSVTHKQPQFMKDPNVCAVKHLE